MSSLALQREYISRFVEQFAPKQRTVQSQSRRTKSYRFFLPLNGQRLLVRRKLFLNTLSISEKAMRTTLQKLESYEVLQMTVGVVDYMIKT